MKHIVQDGDPVLRKTAEEVPLAEIKTEKIRKIIREMRTALGSQKDGVGLAAPQIGYSLRIFIVSALAFHPESKKEQAERDQEVSDVANDAEFSGGGFGIAADKGIPEKDLVFINPELVKVSKEKQAIEEGCLSVRPLYGKVQRSKKSIVRAYDENGRRFERGGSGLLSQIFQHEIDHLNGVLFIDKAKNLHEYVPEEEDEHFDSSYDFDDTNAGE